MGSPKVILVILFCFILTGCDSIEIKKNATLKDTIHQYDVQEYIFDIVELQQYDVYTEIKVIWETFVCRMLQGKINQVEAENVEDFDQAFYSAMVDDSYTSIVVDYGELLKMTFFFENEGSVLKKIRVENISDYDYTEIIANMLSTFQGFTDDEGSLVQIAIYEALQNTNPKMSINNYLIRTTDKYWQITDCK